MMLAMGNPVCPQFSQHFQLLLSSSSTESSGWPARQTLDKAALGALIPSRLRAGSVTVSSLCDDRGMSDQPVTVIEQD